MGIGEGIDKLIYGLAAFALVGFVAVAYAIYRVIT